MHQADISGGWQDEPTCSARRNWGGMEVISAGVKETAFV